MDDQAINPDAGPRGAEVKTLAKGLSILDLLLGGSVLRTGDAAKALDIDKGGASRLMQTLVRAGFARQEADRRYRLGPKLANRSSSRRPKRSLRERARPIIETLAALTSESIHLAVPADERVLYIDAIEANFPLRVDSRPGTFGPIACTAIGRIFMAFGIVAVPDHLEAHTARTITDPVRLEEELQTIVKRGFAVQDEEYYIGMRGVAAPLFDAAGVVIAAVGVSGPSVRMEASALDRMGALVREWALKFPAE